MSRSEHAKGVSVSKSSMRKSRRDEPAGEFRSYDHVLVESASPVDLGAPTVVYFSHAKVSDSYADELLRNGCTAAHPPLPGTLLTFHPTIAVRLPVGMTAAGLGGEKLTRIIAATLHKAAKETAARMAEVAIHATAKRPR
jgi:hypothetical protein